MQTTEPDRILHVVAGVIVEDRHVFLTQRPPGSHLAGKWEFPGGKVTQGESPYAALVRELDEEIGIVVHEAAPFMALRHRYPDKVILLDVWQVKRFSGSPHGREGQQASWQQITALRPSVLPAADRLVLRRLQLPRLYAISAISRYGAASWLRRLDQALAAGLSMLQLREPGMAHPEFSEIAETVIARCHAQGAMVLVNGTTELAIALGADGVHLSSARLLDAQIRPLPEDFLVGASCHNAAELFQAAAIDSDFVVLGPVEATASHPNATPLGWADFSTLCRLTPIPVYALGGMRPHQLSRAQRAGSHGLAMIRGFWEANDFTEVVAAFENGAT